MITMELTARRKKLIKWVGYPLLALLTFVLTVAYTFPYDRLKETIVTRLERDYDVSIASLGPTLIPGGIVIDTMMLETRPEEEDSDAAVLVVDRAKVRAGLFGLLTGSVSVDADVEIGDGRIEGDVLYGSDGLEASVETRALPLERVPMKAVVGLPMTGNLDLDAEVEVPRMRFGKTRGGLELSCTNCTIGDGETRIRPRTRRGRAARGAAFAQSGVTVPQIDLGTLQGAIELEDGEGEIGELSAVSPDGELYVTGELVLSDPVMRSTLPGCVRFKLSEDFEEREPGFGNTALWLPSRALQDDGFYAVPTEGTFKNFRWNPRRSCEGEPAGGDDVQARSRSRSRPSITLRPDEDEGDGDDENEDSDRDRPSVSADDEVADAGRAEETEEDESDDEEDESRRERDAERAAERRREIIEERRSERERREDVEAPVADDEVREENVRDEAREDGRRGDYGDERRPEGDYPDEERRPEGDYEDEGRPEGDYPDERRPDDEYEDNEVDYEVR